MKAKPMHSDVFIQKLFLLLLFIHLSAADRQNANKLNCMKNKQQEGEP